MKSPLLNTQGRLKLGVSVVKIGQHQSYLKPLVLSNIWANTIYEKKDEAPFPQCPLRLETSEQTNVTPMRFKGWL